MAVLELCWPILAGVLRTFVFLAVIPAVRGVLGLPLTGVVATALGLGLVPLQLEPVAGSIFTVALSEVVTGALLALPWLLFAEVIPLTARLFDLARGAHTGEQLAPELGERVTPVGAVAAAFAGAVMLNSNIYELALQPLVQSFNVVSPVSLSRLAASNGWQHLAQSCVALSSLVIRQAVAICLPAFVACLLWDLTVGYLSRYLRGINLLVEFLALKVAVTVVLLSVMIEFAPARLQALRASAIELAQGALAPASASGDTNGNS